MDIRNNLKIPAFSKCLIQSSSSVPVMRKIDADLLITLRLFQRYKREFDRIKSK